MIRHPAAPRETWLFNSRIMHEPTTIMIAGAAISAGTSIYSGMAQGAAYDAQSNLDKQNADLSEDNAAATMELAYQQIISFEEDYDSFESDTVVNYAKSGVRLDSPTVIEIMQSNRANAEVEKANIKYNARVDANAQIVTANQLRTQAAINKMNAKAARITGIANAGASLLTTYGGYKQAKIQTGFTKDYIKTQSIFNQSMIKSQNDFSKKLLELNYSYRQSLIGLGVYQ